MKRKENKKQRHYALSSYMHWTRNYQRDEVSSSFPVGLMINPDKRWWRSSLLLNLWISLIYTNSVCTYLRLFTRSLWGHSCVFVDSCWRRIHCSGRVLANRIKRFQGLCLYRMGLCIWAVQGYVRLGCADGSVWVLNRGCAGLMGTLYLTAPNLLF